MIDFKIGIVESNPERLELMTSAIKETFIVYPFHSGKELLESVESLDLELIIIDFNLSDMSAKELQDRLQQFCPDAPTVLLSSFDRSKTAVQSVKRRAMDYVYKTDDPERFSHDVCKLVRYLIDEQKKTKMESLFEDTGFLPVIQKIYSERNVDMEELKREIDKLKEDS